MTLVEQGRTQEHALTPFRRDRFHAYLRIITNGNVGDNTLWNVLSEVVKDAVREGLQEGSTDRLESISLYLASLRMEMGNQFHLSRVVDRFLKDLKNVGLTQEVPDTTSLLVRLRAEETILTYRGFVLDRTSGKVEKPNGQIVALTPTELDVFLPLISLVGQLVPNEVLTKPFIHLQGKDHIRSLHMYIMYLRNKLDEKDQKTGLWRWITNFPGIGYAFDAPRGINPSALRASLVNEHREQIPGNLKFLQAYIELSVDKDHLPVPPPAVLARQLHKDLTRLGVIKTKRDRRVFEDIDLAGETLSACGFTLDLARREVKRPDGQTVELTKTERDLFALLLRNPGKLLHRDQAIQLFPNSYLPETDIRTYITYLRHKLDEKDRVTGQWRWIKTMVGEGYIFSAE